MTFSALRAARPYRAGPITVRYVRDGSTAPRVGYAVGRVTGGAVKRNRVRRRLRAAAASAPLAPGAYLLSAGSEVLRIPYSELQHAVAAALIEAARS